MRIVSHGIRCTVCALTLGTALAASHERQAPTAKVVVDAGQAACEVQVDADAVGTTDNSGKLALSAVDPSDHYVHVSCPGKPVATYFISPKVNDEVHVGPPQPASAEPNDPTTIADNRLQLRKLLQQALQLRAQEHLDDAVSALRQAMKLDPDNSDLHRELGITFLLAKEWKRARVEMIEAIRNDQSDADAHNGLGYALEKLGDIDAAVKEYRTATHLDPDDPTYRTHYLDALVKIQAKKEAAKK
jgi:tetratricopeptide (TPR) repeat protein